ncbi:unnamed protein product [Rotaria sp. Silwood1]|nr:unnamed protein product [Rotaria sp. Silwood1]CAF1210514.1 unnamed protein product [Rotaria sp. Silwood1]CAF3494586.1 unnamed protein product [Rotaria sp. Silwood1]CAF4911526.1 unnamed protein product [Rotaria sp. Silwood1]
MVNKTYCSILIFICITIICLFIINRYPIKLYRISFRQTRNETIKILHAYDDTEGWISSSLYNELNSYITVRNNNTRYIQKTFIINNGKVTNIPLNYDYINYIKDDHDKTYPYSSWKCSRTSRNDLKEDDEYCILTNIYYQSSTDQYYFFRNPSTTNIEKRRDTFMVSYGVLNLNVIDNIAIIKNLNLAAILKRPLLVTHPPDQNYAHGFLESCGPRFWVLAECQSHPSYIDPTKIQIYYTSKILDGFSSNWNNYVQQSDGTYLPRRRWEQMIQSMFSIYPLLTYRSFNKTTVMFQYVLFTSFKGRTSVWGHHYADRSVNSYPFPTINYRRAYLAYSEWILNNFNLTSKFQLTSIQEELQHKKISEHIPICDETCSIQQQQNHSSNEFTGEWIVVLNRAGAGRREMINADELVTALLKAFPDHSNPYLRVWPKQFNFDDNLYETARMARSIRLLFGVHGAGLSNAVFMRPGAILYEVNPYGCRHLSFNFHRWADVFNLQHALWIPSQGNNGRTNNYCERESSTTLNVKEIINEMKSLLKDEVEYRSGYIKRALKIMTDMSIVDHPPSGFENIF